MLELFELIEYFILVAVYHVLKVIMLMSIENNVSMIGSI